MCATTPCARQSSTASTTWCTRAEVGRLDLDDVGGARAVERADVLDGVRPLVGDELRARPGEPRAQRRERADLGVARAGVERVLDPQRERRAAASASATSTAAIRARSPPHDRAEQAVDVEVQDRRVGVVGAQAQDAVAHPAHVVDAARRRPRRRATGSLISPCGSESTRLRIILSTLSRRSSPVCANTGTRAQRPVQRPTRPARRRPSCGAARCAAASSSAWESP